MYKLKKVLLGVICCSLLVACSPEEEKVENHESPTPTAKPTQPVTKGMTTEELLDRGVTATDENQAISYFDEALKADAMDPFIYDMRASAYESLATKMCKEGCDKSSDAYKTRMTHFNKAIEDYSIAIKLDPWFEGGYKSRGRVYILIGEYDKAIEDFNKILSFSPNNADALNNRGIAYIYTKKYSEAVVDFTNAVENKPDPAFFTARSRAFRELKQYDLALDDANEALALKPRFAGGYYARALTYKAQKQCEKAKVDFEKACELAPASKACQESC